MPPFPSSGGSWKRCSTPSSPFWCAASEIAARILSELEIGGTFLDGVGAYTGEKKEVVMCAVKKHLFPKLKDIVTEEDPTAFLIVSSASEIYGEGYKDHFTENM